MKLRRAHRGEILATVIEYAVMAAAAFAVIAWADSLARHHYVDPVVAQYEKQIAGLKATIKIDEELAQRQGSSLAILSRQAGECTASVERIAEIARFQGAEADRLRLEASRRRAPLQPTIDHDAAVAAGPPTTGLSCDAQLQKVRDLGDEYAKGLLGIK
jgi:hypothetical protein